MSQIEDVIDGLLLLRESGGEEVRAENDFIWVPGDKTRTARVRNKLERLGWQWSFGYSGWSYDTLG